MTGTLSPRLVLVTRETEYEELLVRHATPGQATMFLRRRGQTLEGLDRQRLAVKEVVATVRAGVPKDWRIAAVRRAELDRFIFAPEDVVVAVGQDGLVANLAKYLNGQPVIGVNGDPERNAGILVPHAAADVAALLPLAAAGTLRTEPRTMLQAELDDGQSLLALNEVFIGHASHQSARYSLSWGGREEMQSSSGLIVATGTGATGWALSISRATGIAVALAPEEPAGMFLVREPWPSRATGASLVSGRLGTTDALLVVSRMNEGGVVFADGIEHDRLDFAWGRTLTVRVAGRHLCFVPGRSSSAGGKPAPHVVRRAVPARAVAPAPAPKAPVRSTGGGAALPAVRQAAARQAAGGQPARPAGTRPIGRRRARRWVGLTYLAALGAALLVYECSGPDTPADPAEPPPAPMSQPPG